MNSQSIATVSKSTNTRNYLNDLLIGLTLAAVVLPQAIAFSTTLAGLPPSFGIYATIWGTLFTAMLNYSKVFHGGPNSAMSALIGVILLPVAPQFGVDYMGYAMTLVLAAGVVQLIFFSIKPLRRMLDFISEPVINGLICGIGLFLIFKSFASFAGLPINTEVEWPLWITWQTFIAAIEIGNLYAIQIGILTLVTIVLIRQVKMLKSWSILFGIYAGTLLSEYFIATKGAENLLLEQTANLSNLMILTPSIPLFTQEALPDIIRILPGAVTLALLGLVQTVAAMRRMNRKEGEFIDSKNGIYADGVSNCVLPFLSSLPSCASFNRMGLMHSMGTHSRLAAASSAVFLLVFVIFFSDWIAIIPISSMAAVIMVVGANMISWQDIKAHFENTPERVVFLTSFASVHVFGLFGAIVVGAILALGYAQWVKSHPSISLQNNVLTIRGNIYYGSLPVIESLYKQALEKHRSLTLDFKNVHYIDPEGLRWLESVKHRDNVNLIARRSASERREQARGDDNRRSQNRI